jgi:hypothetical protein
MRRPLLHTASRNQGNEAVPRAGETLMLKWIIAGGVLAGIVILVIRDRQAKQAHNFENSMTSWGIQKDIMKNVCTAPKTCFQIPSLTPGLAPGVFFPGVNL